MWIFTRVSLRILDVGVGVGGCRGKSTKVKNEHEGVLKIFVNRNLDKKYFSQWKLKTKS